MFGRERMSRPPRRVVVAAVAVIAGVLGLVVRNQVKVYQGRQARFALMQQRHPVVPQPFAVVERRQALFDMLQPVALTNCELERFGEAHDGGYLMCGNLIGGSETGYSYGINGYDKWGCDVAARLDVAVHQYDCFNTTQPACFRGETIFHAECVDDTRSTDDGRAFDTIASHFSGNGDASKRVVLKIDVEGAEWDALLTAPDDVLKQVDQLVVEFHFVEDEQFRWIEDVKHLDVVRRLRQFFEVGHIHFNNASCIGDLPPFPSSAYEVLFVSKRLAVIGPSPRIDTLHPLDAPNNSSRADCQPTGR
jgi:hypothetical protein